MRHTLFNAPPKVGLAFSLPRINWNAGLGKCGGDFVLRREDVARAPPDLGAQLDQCLDQDCRLSGHMRTADNEGAV